MEKVTVASLGERKREKRKIAGLAVYDFHMAQIADRIGVDIVGLANSIGKGLWGQPDQYAVTLEEILPACRSVRRGVRRAVLCCDLPRGLLEQGKETAADAALRLMNEGGAEMVEIDVVEFAPENLDAMTAVVRAGVPVSAHFGVFGHPDRREQIVIEKKGELVQQAKTLEKAGASMLNMVNSGPVVGAEVVRAVDIPVVGGLGGGPWLDGRVTLAPNLVGYAASNIDNNTGKYANVAQVMLEAMTAAVTDIRAGHNLRGTA